MSFKAFVWAWQQDVPSGDHLLVLLAIANIAKVREIRASVPYLAKMVRKSPRKVRAAVGWLSEAGLVEVTERPGRVDLIRMNIPRDFVVTMDDDEDEDLEKGARGRPKKTPAHSENPCTEMPKPLANPCPRGADEPIEPDEPKRDADASLPAAPLKSDAAIAFDHWNDLAAEHGWPVAKVLESRRAAIGARIKEAGGLDGFLAAMDDITKSDFLMGRRPGRRGAFVISLDFVLQPQSFRRMLEGNYHRERPDVGSANVGGGGGSADHERRNAAMFAGARAALDRHERERGRSGG